MSLYKITPGTKASGGSGPPLASDVNQAAKILDGTQDGGALQLAGPVTAPASAPSAAATTGTTLGVGTYQYAVTYVTGHLRDDGTIVVSGETTAGPTVSVTTTTGNQSVSLTSLPTSSAATVIGKRVYRTVAGGTSLYLVATLPAGQTSYVDAMSDANIGAPVTRTLSFSGKISGSTAANPHVAKGRVSATFDAPSSFTDEFGTGGYTLLTSQDATTASNSTTTNGQFYQYLFSFDIVSAFIRAGAISSAWTAAMVQTHVATLSASCWLYGVGANAGASTYGASAKIRLGSAWSSYTSGNTSSSPTLLTGSNDQPTAGQLIDSSGFTHFLAHSTYASNGTTAATINVDYMKLDVTVRTAPVPTANTTGTTLTTPVLVIGGPGASRTLDTTFRIDFPNGVANQKLSLALGNSSLSGYIEVEITSTEAFASAVGRVTRLFAISANPNNQIYTNISRYTEAHGTTPTHFAIGNLAWDATNSRYTIPIVHRSSAGNPLAIHVRAFSEEPTIIYALRDNLAIGPVYTTDTTVYPTPVIDMPLPTTIGGNTIFSDGNVGPNAPNNAVQLVKAMLQPIDTRTTTLARTGTRLTSVVEKDAGTTVKTTTLNYTGNRLTSVVEVVGGKTITETLVYDGTGKLTDTTRTVTP